MKHLICPATGVLQIVDLAQPELDDGGLLVRMTACGICGTDLMKVYDPSVAKPVQLGHEIAGVVAAGKATGFTVGTRVAVAHHAPDYASHYTQRGSATQDPAFKKSNIEPGGFCEVVKVPPDLVPHTVHVIPDSMPATRAIFMEPLACCLRALERVDVAAGDTVLIIGAGAIGMLFVPLLRGRGATVLAADIRLERLQLARRWGASAQLKFGEDDIAQATRQVSQGRGADVVILTVVNEATLSAALEGVRDGGWLIPFGVKPGTTLPIDLWQLYRREISLVTSYSATPEGLRAAMKRLESDAFAFESLISHDFALIDAAKGFDLLHKGQASKVVITNH